MSDTSAGAGIFPLPAIDVPWTSFSSSRRIQARSRSANHVTSIANQSIDALNQLYFSFVQPSHPSPFMQVKNSPPSASQSRLAAHIYSCAQRFHRRRALPSSGAASDDSLSELVLDQHVSHLFSAGYSKSATAIPLVADRVALPSVAGAVRLLDVLPPHIAHLYAGPSSCLRPPDPILPRPRPRVFASHTEYVKLIRRMVSAGMLAFTTAPAVINGLFGVAKPDGNIRLVIDGRPCNATFIDPPRVELPTPDLLPRLMVPPHRTLWVAKSDLADFFYRFRVPDWMQPYFALPSVPVEELGVEQQQQFGAGVIVYPCLTVLAMGWSHSVFVAQNAHEHLLNTRTRLQPMDRITSTSDLYVDRLRHMVYIDDLILLSTDKSDVMSAQHEYLAAVASANLPAKPSKVIHPSCDGVDCLGIELNGREHTVAPRADKLERLRFDTVRLLARGTCTGRDMAQLVGRWTWLMLVTRPALACFNSVYRFIQSAGRRVFTLWPTVARELWVVARLSPLFVTSLSAPWYSHVMATDASLSGTGVVAARVADDVVSLAARISGSASLASKSMVDNSIDHTLLQRPWSTLVSAPWRREEHINQLELLSVSIAVRRVLSSPSSIRHRLLVLSDSQVAVGALSKGRSSSHKLLRRIRPLSALLLGSGLQLHLRWIPSESNPADGPSRAWT